GKLVLVLAGFGLWQNGITRDTVATHRVRFLFLNFWYTIFEIRLVHLGLRIKVAEILDSPTNAGVRQFMDCRSARGEFRHYLFFFSAWLGEINTRENL
ncbi:MAG: hypothetical protein AAB568_03120, partial [Patescibacteria group bacterium]